MTIKFSPAVVQKLLHGLAHDDDFRAAFERDPRAALSDIGHDTPQQHIGVEGKDPVLPFLSLKGGLASKQRIAASKDQMEADYNADAVSGAKGPVFTQFTICAE